MDALGQYGLSGGTALGVPGLSFGNSASDPLAAITFALRLQTHNGDNVPLGLYQDTACTIPATAEGHSIAAWRDELSAPSGPVAIRVSGAGSTGVYGDYLDDGFGTLREGGDPTGKAIYGGSGQWYLEAAYGGSALYSGVGASPQTAVWTPVGSGLLPGPTFSEVVTRIKATQSNAMKRPTLRFVGGVPVVRFDPVDDTLMVANFASFPSQRGSLSIVARNKNAGPGGVVAGGWIFYDYNGPVFRWWDGVATYVAGTAAGAAWSRHLVVQSTNTLLTYYRDATSDAVITVQDAQHAVADLFIGLINGNAEFDVCSVIFSPSVFDADTRVVLDAYLEGLHP